MGRASDCQYCALMMIFPQWISPLAVRVLILGFVALVVNVKPSHSYFCALPSL
jgi:hypothetical protein